jgi:hypothetical protein
VLQKESFLDFFKVMQERVLKAEGVIKNDEIFNYVFKMLGVNLVESFSRANIKIQICSMFSEPFVADKSLAKSSSKPAEK